MFILDLLSKPFIYGITKGAQAALKGTKIAGAMAVRNVPGETTIDRVGNFVTGVVKTAASTAGENTLRGIERAGGYIDAATAAAKPFVRPFLKKENNLIGWKVRSGAGDVLFWGTTAVGVLGGMRNAQVGLVNYGPMTSLTGEALTPGLYNQQIKPNWVDNLGADGSLALALHQLRK